MHRAVRIAVRSIGFFVLRISRLLERSGRGLAVATFTRAELDELAVAEWESFGRSGPIVGDEPFAWETEFFSKHIRPGDSILVAGAGTGRDVIPLLEAGHLVTALDIAPQALNALKEGARIRGLAVNTVQASIATAALPPAAFDVVLFSWFCFAYLHGEEERRQALVRSASALRPGGRILLSYPPRAASDERAASPSRLGRAASRLLGGLRIEAGDQYVVSGTATGPGIFFTHSFRPSDIESDAVRAGLRVAVHAQPIISVGFVVLEQGPAS